MKRYNASSGTATHVFMDNGKIHVPDEDYPEFLHMYYKALCNDEHPCIVERTGYNCMFRYFLDIDLKPGVSVEDALVHIYNESNRLINMVGDIYVCNKQQGIHIIYNTVVQCDEAIIHCKKLKSCLCEKYNQCVDISVYKTGLRMIGAYKHKDTRYYEPYNNELSWKTFKHSVVRVKSLAVVEKCTSTCEYTNIDLFLQNAYNNESLKVTSYKKMNNYVSCCTNSKYCENVKRCHKNAKVYYVFDLHKKVCYQKCFCTCENQLPFSSCRNYKGIHINVPYMLISHLQTI